MENEVKLTKLAKCAGCGPVEILKQIPVEEIK